MNDTDALAMLHKAVNHAKDVTGIDLYQLGWSIRLNDSKRSLGLCRYHSKSIEISRRFFSLVSQDETWDTCLHETAHALCPKQHHNRHWKSVFIKLGGSGQVRFTGSVDGLELGASYFLIDRRNGRVVRHFLRKPSRDYSKLALKGDPASKGKLALVEASVYRRHPTPDKIKAYLGSQPQPSTSEAPQRKPKYYLVDGRTGKPVRRYFRRPRIHASSVYLANDPDSLGHLHLMDTITYEFLGSPDKVVSSLRRSR